MLQEFNFKIFHKTRRENLGADFLSRSTSEEQQKSMQDMPADAELFAEAGEQEMQEDGQDWEPELVHHALNIGT